MSNDDALIEVYKLHAELTERAAALREEFTKLYTGMVTAVVAAGVLLHRFASDSELAWALPVLGMAVSVSWLLSFWSVTARLTAKHGTLLELEKQLPFDFLTREGSITPWPLHRKITGSVMPLLFFAVCAYWYGAG